MLDDLDAELERRGHRFVRYADDLRVYVHSERAGARVMASITTFIEQRLKLRVNRPSRRSPRPRPALSGVRVLPPRRHGQDRRQRQGPRAGQDRLRELTARTWGVSMDRRIHAINRFTVGWTAYYRLADGERPFRDLDKWLAVGCGRCGGRNGSAPRLGGATCARTGPLSGPPANGRPAAKVPGASRAPGSCPPPRPTPTGQPRPARIHRSPPPFPRRNANRRMRTPCPVVWEAPG